MKKEILRHKIAYFALLVFLILIAVSYLVVWPDRIWQRIIAVGLGVGYWIWGIVTHTKSNHVTPRIVFEYLMIGALASALLTIITL